MYLWSVISILNKNEKSLQNYKFFRRRFLPVINEFRIVL